MTTATQKRPARGRPRSEETEQAILNATIELLLEGDYSSLTIRQIAQRAGAGATTIYRRWPTKEALVIAALNKLPTLVPHNSGSLIGDLTDLTGQYRKFSHSSVLRALPIVINQSADNPVLESALEAFMEQRRVPLRICVKRGIERGELPEDADVELAVDMIQGAFFLRGYLLSKQVSEKWLSDMLSILIRGFSTGRT